MFFPFDPKNYTDISANQCKVRTSQNLNRKKKFETEGDRSIRILRTFLGQNLSLFFERIYNKIYQRSIFTVINYDF